MLVTKPYRRLSLQAATLVQATIFLAATQTNANTESNQKEPIIASSARNANIKQDPEAKLSNRHNESLTSFCMPHASCKFRSELEHVDKLSEFICQCDEECRMYDDCCPDAEHETLSLQQTTTNNPIEILAIKKSNRTARESNEELTETNLNDQLDLRNRIEARNRWHCQQIDDGPEGVLVMSSCPANWWEDVAEMTPKLASQIELRCNFARKLMSQKQREPNNINLNSINNSDNYNETSENLWNAYKSDPLGTIIPVTDLLTGITYANSYCLRCNREIIRKNQQSNSINAMQFVKPKLVSWKPIIKCNFQSELFNKMSLSQLVRTYKANALEYSAKLNKWLVNTYLMDSANDQKQKLHSQSQMQTQRNKLINLVLSNQRSKQVVGNASQDVPSVERQLCLLEPTPRDSSRSVLRACRADTIRTCIGHPNLDYKLHWDCLNGHQILVFSKRRAGIAYHNLACALCNDEQLDSVSCEPLMKTTQSQLQTQNYSNEPNTIPKQQLNPLLVIQQQLNAKKYNTTSNKNETSSTNKLNSATTNQLATTTTTTTTITTTSLSSSSSKSSQSTTINMKPFTAPFSVLFDWFGSSKSDLDSAGHVGSSHQCPGLHQVYDPFFLTCRCLVCGLNRFYKEGRCVDRTSNKVSEIT